MVENFLNNPAWEKYLLAIVGAIIGYLFSQLKQSKDMKLSALTKRYETLYSPLLQLIVESWTYVKIPSQFSPELREDFIKLFKENVGQMGTESYEYYPEFYESYLFYIQETIGNIQFKNATEKFDIKFNKFCNILIKECSDIRVKLKYDKLPDRFSKSYSCIIEE